MKKYLWCVQVYKTELYKTITYRFDFWIQLVFSILAHLGASYFLWKAVFDYQKVETLRGFSLKGLMFYYLMIPITNRIVNGPGLGNIAHEIYDGSLTRYLIYPVNFFIFKYVQYIANATIFIFQLFLCLTIFSIIFGIPHDIHISITSIFFSIITLSIAGLVAFSMSTVIEFIAFWADNVWSLLVLIRFSVGLLGGAMLPLAFFPNSLQKVMHLLPFSTLSSLPIETLLGKISMYQLGFRLLIALAWVFIFLIIAQILWNKGKYKYTGVGI